MGSVCCVYTKDQLRKDPVDKYSTHASFIQKQPEGYLKRTKGIPQNNTPVTFDSFHHLEEKRITAIYKRDHESNDSRDNGILQCKIKFFNFLLY